jgi:LPXTG-motif cell wall-anchored protein
MTRTSTGRMLALVVTAALFMAVLIPALSATAGASAGCGQHSYGFTGTRLLNDGISDMAGPYSIDLPAGTYAVTLVAHDHHDAQVGVPTQPGEQYVVVLDSGYTSPPSTDIADDATVTTTIFPGQVIGASTSITVRHGGVPGINSVDVVCVGFTPEADSDAVIEGPSIPADDVPAQPDIEAPAEEPVQDIGDPVGIVREPEIVPPAEITTEVKGTVEAPPAAPQLALTGPGAHAQTMVLLGVVMISFGALLLRRERRFQSR